MPVKRASVKSKSRKVFGHPGKRSKAALRAGLYTRVSTNDQQTLPMQLRALREYAARRGWAIAMQVKEVGSDLSQRQMREFLTVKAKGSTGTARAPAIRDDVNITAGDEEIRGTRLNKAGGGTQVLNLPRVWGRSNQHRVLANRRRPVHIRQQGNAIAHGRDNIVVVSHFEGRLRQIAIVSARSLRTVEPTLTGIEARRLNIRHGDAPLIGNAISLSVYLPLPVSALVDK